MCICMFFLITADSQWFTVIYTPRASWECNFVMKKRLKSALNMPNLNGTLNLFAKHCVYSLWGEGEGVGWLVWCASLFFCAGSSGKVRLKYERENLATIISANRWSFRRRVIYIDEKCLKLKLKLKSLPLFTVTHRSSRRRSWRRSSCCHSLANCQVAVALWIMQRVQREQVAGLPGSVLGVDILTTGTGCGSSSSRLASFNITVTQFRKLQQAAKFICSLVATQKFYKF